MHYVLWKMATKWSDTPPKCFITILK